jgi:NADH-quinone oxidoreductase subunit L
MFNNPGNFAWFILLPPLVAAGIIAMFTRHHRRLSAQLSICAVLISFLATAILSGILRSVGADAMGPARMTWLSIGNMGGSHLWVDISLRLDHLSLAMALVVTGVGSLIHIYSAGYMRGERAYGRYFACMSLFMFSMLGIVLADNFVMMFIFWELVGVSSYLLIGFWYEREAAADACKKAFLCNRVGDYGFLLGILIVWAMFGSVNFDEIKTGVTAFAAAHNMPTPLFYAAGLLIFCGAVGKSAQFPLHVWLPDAMEGPTPVSALIHAATMVAAGVYMLCRVYFLLEPSGALTVIAWTGGFTAFLAAVIAIQQNDIKRILAYSTLSQLGYMVMAVGTGSPAAAMFHLTTHAFFKALLFLGAGSVILALHHEQNIWRMGALKKKLPVTYWTFMAGTLALCGCPPLSGFYSKDSILAQTLKSGQYGLFVLGVVVAMLTTFYMFRLVVVAFWGGEKSEAAGHAHESPRIMIWPLRVLAIFSVIGGFIGFDRLYAAVFDNETAVPAGLAAQILEPFSASPLGTLFGIAAFGFGLCMAYAAYRGRTTDPLPERLGWLSRAMRNRFYFDELYERVLIPCTQEAASKLADAFDRWIIYGAVRFASGSTDLCGRALRLVQAGSLQVYAFTLVLGVAIVLYFVLG